MKIVICPDKFKDSMSAIDVCSSLKKGLLVNNSDLNIISCPMADGGEGSLEILNYYLDLKPEEIIVNDPLFRPIKSTYYLSGKTAYIEMSSASGLYLLKKEERNCMNTSSIGTGQLILDAIKKGATSINLFVGGSATNDGGIGIASALGYLFYDSLDNLLIPKGQNLLSIHRIDKSEVKFNLKKININVICDVNNPLHGKNGAACVFASQKGANPNEINQLDKGLINLESVLIKHDFPNIANIPGSGAAGGVGGGSIAFLGAKLISGIQNFIKITQLERLIKDCNLIITGEGKLDSQTEKGKVISGVSKLALKYKKPIIAICGDADLETSKKLGIKKVYTILERAKSIEDSKKRVGDYLTEIGMELLANL
mgnify:FL=1